MESQIYKIHKDLIDGKYSCTELVSQKLKDLEANPQNTSNYLLATTAMEAAAKVDRKLGNGDEIGILEGIPFGLKDLFLLRSCHASASSDFLKNYISPYTATAIQKLIDEGAIPVVKENCDSFGHGSSSENTAFGPVKNAWDDKLVSGGSSGGSAVNVAKGYTVFSIGGDTGGSIRQPAVYNKVYGLKPTYGRISRYGLMAYASSTDCVGPLSKSLEDIRILLNIMSGKDYHDQTTIESSQIPVDIFLEKFDPEIKEDFLALIDRLKQHNIKIKKLDFFDTDILVSTYYIIAMAETASNLARLDGMNYGERMTAETLKEGYASTRSVNFTEETKRRIVGGNQVLSYGHSEEIYLKARNLRDRITGSFDRDFRETDIILSPVSPAAPPRIGSSLQNPLEMYLSDVYTRTGIQITAPKNQEEIILKFAKFLTEIM